MVITTEGRLREGCPMKKNLTITAALIAAAVIAIVTFSSPPETPPAEPPATCDVPSSISIPDARTTPPYAPPVVVPTRGNRGHVYAGLPRSTQPVTVLENTGFIVGYSDARRNPLWVSYRVFKIASVTTHKRPGRFQVDDRTQARVKHDDYTHSGYDRGHMAPNYAIVTRYGRQAQLKTFLMSNISPQKPSLNRYIWKDLEMLVAKRYASSLEEVWVICGPIFDDDIEKLASGVEVPDAYYKIIVDEKDGKVRVLAFIMSQGVGTGERNNLAKFLTSVDEIERQTGLDFLHELSDDVEDAVEAEKAEPMW